jgi:hydroxyacylglutathione hydrolase
MKIIDGIYGYIWRGVFENNCNMYYLGAPLNVLIDPGLQRQLDLRFDDMRKDGIDVNDVKYCLNTHAHPDHFDGCRYFMEKGVPVGLHPDEIAFVNEFGPAFFSMMGMQFPELKYDIILNEGTWKAGDTELEIFHTPGHSPGSVCIYWHEKKALICGDLVFKESVGRVDFPGGDPAKLKESIEKVASLDIELLLPGHMDIVRGADQVKRNFDLIRQYIFPQI